MAVKSKSKVDTNKFWPGDTRLVMSISMQFEAGGQPPKGTDSPFPKVDFPDSVTSDPAANTWFAYGYREGIPRMLDLWDRHGVKVTSHMIGEAAKKHPELAREIVGRGHEAAGHGPRWSSQYAMSREEERQFIAEGTRMVEEVTGTITTVAGNFAMGAGYGGDGPAAERATEFSCLSSVDAAGDSSMAAFINSVIGEWMEPGGLPRSRSTSSPSDFVIDPTGNVAMIDPMDEALTLVVRTIPNGNDSVHRTSTHRHCAGRDRHKHGEPTLLSYSRRPPDST